MKLFTRFGVSYINFFSSAKSRNLYFQIVIRIYTRERERERGREGEREREQIRMEGEETVKNSKSEVRGLENIRKFYRC